METQLQVGDKVLIRGGECGEAGKITTITEIEVDGKFAKTNLCISWHPISSFEKINKTEEITMQIKELKKENLTEAVKQFSNERKNEEIEYAKKEYRNAIDKINEIDRQIKALVESKKPYQETIRIFS
jgi:preprotein translocase subunit YajC